MSKIKQVATSLALILQRPGAKSNLDVARQLSKDTGMSEERCLQWTRRIREDEDLREMYKKHIHE